MTGLWCLDIWAIFCIICFCTLFIIYNFIIVSCLWTQSHCLKWREYEVSGGKESWIIGIKLSKPQPNLDQKAGFYLKMTLQTPTIRRIEKRFLFLNNNSVKKQKNKSKLEQGNLSKMPPKGYDGKNIRRQGQGKVKAKSRQGQGKVNAT